MICDQWLPVLQHGKIAKVEPFSNGLSLKYRIIFETGHVAMCKLMDPLDQLRMFRSATSHSVIEWDP